MDNRIRVWLDDDRRTMHHASAAQVEDMTVTSVGGVTDCGREGTLSLVHHENVDTGALCPGCIAVTGVRPPLEGVDPGPA